MVGAAGSLNHPLDRVTFHLGDSALTAPTTELPPLDILLVDGAHAFPYPVLDWYYLSRTLREGGVLVVDDAWMPSVRVLTEFLEAEDHWELEWRSDQTHWYRRGSVHPAPSTYPDGWDTQGINRSAARFLNDLTTYTKLPLRRKVLSHPVMTAKLLRRRLTGAQRIRQAAERSTRGKR